MNVPSTTLIVCGFLLLQPANGFTQHPPLSHPVNCPITTIALLKEGRVINTDQAHKAWSNLSTEDERIEANAFILSLAVTAEKDANDAHALWMKSGNKTQDASNPLYVRWNNKSQRYQQIRLLASRLGVRISGPGGVRGWA